MSYTAASYIISQGTTLAHSTTAGGTYTVFADIMDVEIPPQKRDKSDATNLASLQETTLPGWVKESEAKFTCYLVAAQVTTIQGLDFLSGTNVVYWFKLVYPLAPGQSVAGNQWLWPGYLTGFEPSKVEKLSNDHLSYVVTIQCVQIPVFTAGS